MSKPSLAKQAAPKARAVTGPGNVVGGAVVGPWALKMPNEPVTHYPKGRPNVPRRNGALVAETGSASGAPQVTRAAAKPCKQCEATHGPKWTSCVHKVGAKGSAANPYAVCTTSVGSQQERKREAAKAVKKNGSMHFVARFKEAAADVAGKGKRFRVTMLQEGLGNFGDAFYYTSDAIKSAPPIFEGKKFMINHPSESEEVDRPERDVRDISGYFENCAAEPTDDGRVALMGDLVVAGDPSDPTDAFKRERVLILESIDFQKKHPDQDLVALSINAGGDYDTTPIEQFIASGQFSDACKAKLLEAVQRGVTEIRPVRAMTTASSCDLVTTAGAGGSINQLLEGGKDKMAKQAKQAKEAKEKHEGEAHEAETHHEAEGEGEDGMGAGADGGDADGQTGEHPDAEQDKSLIAKMLAKYLGDGFTDQDHEAAKQAYESAKGMGFDDKHAEAIAAHEVAKMRAGGGMHQTEAHHEAEKQEGEAHEAGYDGVTDVHGKASVGSAGSAKDMQKNKESARKAAQGGSDVVKLTARVAFLESELEKSRLEKHVDVKLRESKLPMAASKKFRECVKNIKTVAEFDKSLAIFKEAYGLRGEAQTEGGFILGAEKQGGVDGDGTAGLDFSDCVAE